MKHLVTIILLFLALGGVITHQFENIQHQKRIIEAQNVRITSIGDELRKMSDALQATLEETEACQNTVAITKQELVEERKMCEQQIAKIEFDHTIKVRAIESTYRDSIQKRDKTILILKKSLESTFQENEELEKHLILVNDEYVRSKKKCGNLLDSLDRKESEILLVKQLFELNANNSNQNKSYREPKKAGNLVLFIVALVVVILIASYHNAF